ncbi:MAG: hypothetical protein Q7W13_02090 [Bacteroidia bacterium]|nr:hypothetical protein [Bacteroidia bacterium]
MKIKTTLLVMAILTSINCNALNYFWVGGSGSWSDFNNHWATTSGGNIFHNQVPQSTDNVYFDALSFTAATPTVTIDQTIVQCADMTWIGVFNTPTLLGSSFDTLRIFGSLALGAGMNFNLNGQVSMEAITGKTITTSGTIINASLTFNGIGGSWTLQDALRVTNVIYLNNGNLNTNNNNVNSSAFYSNTVSTRSLHMGSSIFNLSNYNGVVWTINPAGMTLDAGTSTINGIGNGGSFTGGGFTYNDLFFTGIAIGNIYDNNTFHDVSFASDGVIFGSNTFHDVSFAGNATIYGNPMFGPNTFNNVTIAKNGTFWSGNIFNNLSFSPGYSYTLQAGQTQTVGNICAQGTGALPIRIQSGTAGVPAIISKASGTICWDYVHISDITATGGATFNAGLVPTRSQNLGGNTGLLFTGGCTAVSCLPCTAPSITTNPISISVCVGTIANFSIISIGVNLTYQWQVNQGAGFINLSGIGSNLLGVQFVSAAMNGFQYRCLVSSGACSSISNAATLTVNPAPIVTVNSATICSGQTATLTASGATSYFWPSGALPPAPPVPPVPPLPPPPIGGLTTNPIFVSPLVTTTYTVTGTTNGCSNTAIAMVTVYPMPTTISAGQDVTIASNTPVQLGSAFIPAFSYSWSPTTGLSNANVSNPTLVLQNSGSTSQTFTYILTATNGQCSKIDTVLITVTPSQTPSINQMPDLDEEMAMPNASFYDIQSRVRAYFLANPDSTEVDGLSAKFNRWEWFWQGRVDDPITKSKSGGFNAAYKALAEFIQQPICNTPSSITSNWTALGPFKQPNPSTDQNMGIIWTLYVDPFNHNNIFAGSNTSGLFKTTNGGATWNNPDVSRLPAMGIRSIVVDPASGNQTIYVATGMEAMARSGYGIGVLKSTDGGAHWNRTALSMTPTSNLYNDFNVYKIIRDPNNIPNSTNIYYAITDHKVYKTTDGFSNSLLDRTPNNADHFRDIQFRASFSDNLFAVGDNKIYQSLNAGNTWTNLTSNLTSTTDLDKMRISVTASDLYVLYFSGSPAQAFIDKYNFSSGTWLLVSNPNLTYDNYVFTVSPADPQVMYAGRGQGTLLKSTTGGSNFSSITNYNQSYNGTYTHSDIRAVQLVQASADGFGTGTADRLFVGNDGGVLKTLNGGASWTNINGTGLNITQFYGIGGTESNPNLIVAGAQDNGLYTYNAPNWSVQVVGDAYDACIDKTDPNIMFGAYNGGFGNQLDKSTLGGGVSWGGGGIAQPPGASLTNRPLFIDNNNNWYAGYHDVFKSTSQGGSWTVPANGGFKISNFTTDFNTTATLPGGIVYNSVPSSKPLVALAVAQSDPSVIYAAYDGATWDTNPATGQSSGDGPQALAKTIFRTTDGGTSWTDITAGLEAIRWAGITRIAVDPNNPYRIWLSFNEFNFSSPGVGENRVVYGHDVNGVWTWTDHSKGLPQFPVLSIVYQNGSDDGLYVGTDVGVYYTNSSLYPQQGAQQGWVCFSANLPVVMVTDLEINYCAGKIRAATHGRGLWESPLAPPSVPQTLLTGTISSPVKYTNDVTIPTGNTVTVTSKINMAEGKKIIVERGGNLILNGGTITNDCGLMWQGIELQGNRAASQLTAGAQGKIILKNAALIENAREGISTIKTDANGNMDWDYTGGIIQASNSTFRNCRRDVQYLSYRNFHPNSPGITMPDLGRFSNCIFETTQQLNDPNANLETRVTLYDVRGIRFLGNDFRNTAPPDANNGIRASGIGSLDANYRVANLCLSTLFPCTNSKSNTFTNLDYGIYANNSNPIIKVDINGAIFFNNTYDGVHLKGMNYPSVNNCSFHVGNSPSQLSSGLYLDNCKYYSVQNNVFNPSIPAYGVSAVGMWVNDSKLGAHEIYNNKFTGLYAGIVPLNDNSGMTNYTDGLTIHCNEFVGNAYDIGITGSGQNNSIAYVQGTPNSGGSNPSDLVRNRYSAACGNENQFFITGSTKYVIHATNSDANTQPLPQPSCSDALVLVAPTSHAWQPSDCPNKLLLNVTQVSAMIATLAVRSLTLNNTYTSLVDGGNTLQLLNAVNSSMPAGNLKNTLMSKSPYLSDQVLVSYLTKPVTPPPGHIKDVVIANSPVTVAVKLKVDALNLPNGIKQQISTAQIGISQRLMLEAQIIQTDFERQLYTAYKINYFLNDTLETNPIDSVIKMLTVEPRPYSSKELVQAYISKGDYANALSLINSQPTNDFYELQKLIIQVNQAPEKAYSMKTNAALKSSIEAYANDCSKEGCAYAQALLRQVFNYQYPELRMLPGSLNQRNMQINVNSEQPVVDT